MKSQADDRQQRNDEIRKEDECTDAHGKARTGEDGAKRQLCPTDEGDFKRAKLVTMLERLNLSVVSFDRLRADAYEKHLAQGSIEELEQGYLTLLNPGEPCEEVQKKFPRWRSGKNVGNLPSINTLMSIKQRLLADYLANDLGRLESMLETLRNRCTGLSMEQPSEIYNVMLSVMGEEMLRAKSDGKPITENLPLVDRLMRAAAIRFRERQGDRRLTLRETTNKNLASKLELEWKKFEQKTAKLEETTVASAVIVDNTDEVVDHVFGKNPFADQNASSPSQSVPSQQPSPVLRTADDRQQMGNTE